MNGKVKMYNDEKGYGFIKGEDGNDYFFHCSNLENFEAVVNRGMRVSFTPSQNVKGLEAIKITVFVTPTFIMLDEYRIRLSQIKDYETWSHENKPNRNTASDGEALALLLKDFGLFGGHSTPTTTYYLRITTYQNMEYIYETENYSEMKSKINELDAYFGVR